jgi:hypothetical protein
MTAVLSRVSYLRFEHEVEEGGLDLSAPEHSLDAELRLEYSDGSTQFVSWTSAPVQYCIGVKDGTWFDPGFTTEVDVSSHPLWLELVGHPIVLEWRGSEHQVLEVRGEKESVYLASRDGPYWCGDCVRVSRAMPELPSNTSLEQTRGR